MSMVSGVYGYSAAYMSMAVPVALGILVTFLTTRKVRPIWLEQRVNSKLRHRLTSFSRLTYNSGGIFFTK